MDPLLTPRDLSTVIALSRQTIYNRRATGGDLPPTILLGRHVCYKMADVHQWVERHREGHNDNTGTNSRDGGCA